MSVLNCLSIMLFTSVVVLRADTVLNVYTSDSQHAANEGKCKFARIIAFSVARKATFAPSSRSRVPMDHVIYNKGGYFNMKTSIFTAPVSGVYAFWFGGSGIYKKPLHLCLRAGNPENDVVATHNQVTHPAQAAGSVIIEMKKGDHASLWLYAGHALNSFTVPSIHFNGYLVSETNNE